MSFLDRKCLECGESFKALESYVKRGHGKFCSTACAAKYGNKQRNSKLIATNCSSCLALLLRKPSQFTKGKKFYCNRQCKRNGEFNSDSKNRAGSQSSARRDSNRRRAHLAAKDALIAKLGVICMVFACPNDLKGDRSLVDMHHFGNPTDHSLTILLCPYHHRLADKGYITFNEPRVTISGW